MFSVLSIRSRSRLEYLFCNSSNFCNARSRFFTRTSWSISFFLSALSLLLSIRSWISTAIFSVHSKSDRICWVSQKSTQIFTLLRFQNNLQSVLFQILTNELKKPFTGISAQFNAFHIKGLILPNAIPIFVTIFPNTTPTWLVNQLMRVFILFKNWLKEFSIIDIFVIVSVANQVIAIHMSWNQATTFGANSSMRDSPSIIKLAAGSKSLFKLFENIAHFCQSVRASSAVFCSAHWESSRASIYSSISNLPSRTASAKSGPARDHNKSIAILVASHTSPASFILFVSSANHCAGSLIHSLAIAQSAIESPENIFSVATHSFSNLDNSAILVSRSNHKALSCTQYCTLVFVSLSIETHDTWDAITSLSRVVVVSSIGIHISKRNLDTPRIELCTSVCVTLAKFKKSSVRYSSSLHVTLNLVFISPVAFAIVRRFSGTLWDTFEATFCNSIRALPHAHVNFTKELRAWSTWFPNLTKEVIVNIHASGPLSFERIHENLDVVPVTFPISRSVWFISFWSDLNLLDPISVVSSSRLSFDTLSFSFAMVFTFPSASVLSFLRPLSAHEFKDFSISSQALLIFWNSEITELTVHLFACIQTRRFPIIVCMHYQIIHGELVYLDQCYFASISSPLSCTLASQWCIQGF